MILFFKLAKIVNYHQYPYLTINSNSGQHQKHSSAMFILDANQQHHLLLILNELNRHIYENTVLSNKTGKNVQKIQKKTSPSLITGFNNDNCQHLIDFVLSTIRYFRTFFKFTSSTGLFYFDFCFVGTNLIVFFFNF